MGDAAGCEVAIQLEDDEAVSWAGIGALGVDATKLATNPPVGPPHSHTKEVKTETTVTGRTR